MLKLKIESPDLVEFSKRMAAAAKVTQPVIAAGINEVGDSLVSVLASSLVQQTGLSLEQVRGLIKVDRASRGDATYKLTINEGLYEDQALRKLEGKRESTDFGKQMTGELVIVVSKKDELVCMDCEELAAAGPMPVEIARQHVPKHPHCRCIIMPYVQKGKRLPVTMTTLSGTGRGKKVEVESTIRQLAQTILNKATRTVKIEL